jgi:hypothetical protein
MIGSHSWKIKPENFPGGDSHFIFAGRIVTDLRRPCSAHSLGAKVGHSNCCYLCRLATVSISPQSPIFLRGRECCSEPAVSIWYPQGTGISSAALKP